MNIYFEKEIISLKINILKLVLKIKKPQEIGLLIWAVYSDL